MHIRWTAIQDNLAAALGCDAATRHTIVAAMLRSTPSEATGYWLQLLVAVGIATLGLALGSTAVIIGAMLIAPLMIPIVALGMGLAAGSPFLVLRATVRIALSVVVAIVSSAVLTRLLPFHELTAEIAARSTPTALDLLVAAFCALAAVYASLRPASDTASTAAGTSIGISLVPPLCVSGYGVGTGLFGVAGGAALLFLTNFVAIVFVATLAFATTGFNQVDVELLESTDEQLTSGWSAGVARRLERLFASRSGPAVRLMMPVILLAGVYVPLQNALHEVAWQVRVRGQVNRAMDALDAHVVESRVRVERGEIELALVVLGSAADAATANKTLDDQLRQSTGVEPKINVRAVPDATALAGIEAQLRRPTVTPPPEPTASERLAAAEAMVQSALRDRWPERSAGPLLQALVSVEPAPTVTLWVVHRGPPLDAAARETLERVLAADLGRDLRLVDQAIPDEIGGPEPQFLSALANLLPAIASLPNLHACVEMPARRREDVYAVSVRALVDGSPQATLLPGSGTSWRARVSDVPCAPADNTGAPVGHAGAVL